MESEVEILLKKIVQLKMDYIRVLLEDYDGV